MGKNSKYFYAFLYLGITMPFSSLHASFTFAELDTAKDLSLGQLKSNALSVNEAVLLQYINRSFQIGYTGGGATVLLNFCFRTTGASIVNGRYTFSDLNALTQGIFAASFNDQPAPPSLSTVTVPLPQGSTSSSFTAADVQTWKDYTSAQFEEAATETSAVAAGQSFLDYLNQGWVSWQAGNGGSLSTLATYQYGISFLRSMATPTTNPLYIQNFYFPSFTALQNAGWDGGSGSRNYNAVVERFIA